MTKSKKNPARLAMCLPCGISWWNAQSASLGEKLLNSSHALDQIVIGQSVGEANEARGAEGFARDNCDLNLIEDQVSELARRVGHAASERTR